jgi:hypothetical protein
VRQEEAFGARRERWLKDVPDAGPRPPFTGELVYYQSGDHGEGGTSKKRMTTDLSASGRPG